MPDTVTLVLDAQQYHRELAKITAANQRLSGSGERIGEGFLRGERAFRRSASGFVSGMLTIGNATDATLIGLQSLERVFRIGIGPTVAIVAGITAFEAMRAQVKKTNDAYKDLKDELAKPLIADAVTAEADAKIAELTKKIEALHKEVEKPISKTSGMFAALAGIASSALLPSFLRGPAISALSGLAPVGIGKIQQATDEAGKRLEAFAGQKGEAILRAADKLHEALREAVTRFRTSTGNLFRDIGSGQFAKDQQQRSLENLQTKAGQDMVRGFEDAIARGIPINQLAADMVNAARAAAAKGGVGIQDILNADFSNLDLLSKYDFSGLAPLSGITISIQ